MIGDGEEKPDFAGDSRSMGRNPAADRSPASTARPARPRLNVPHPGLRAVITDDGSCTLEELAGGQTYRSESGALAESQHVFLENSGVGDRLRGGRPATVLETGFGTGLSFWLTASEAMQSGAVLDFVSIERLVIPAAVIAALGYDRLAACRPALEQLLPGLEAARVAGAEQAELEGGSVRLRLLVGEATELVSQLTGPFDAIYHDPFSPEASPQLWSPEFLRCLARLLAPGGRLVTYCVKSEIQRRLRATGLVVKTVPGPPGGKREVLIATKPDSMLRH